MASRNISPSDDPALNYYQSLGVDFVEPDGDDYFWEILS